MGLGYILKENRRAKETTLGIENPNKDGRNSRKRALKITVPPWALPVYRALAPFHLIPLIYYRWLRGVLYFDEKNVTGRVFSAVSQGEGGIPAEKTEKMRVCILSKLSILYKVKKNNPDSILYHLEEKNPQSIILKNYRATSRATQFATSSISFPVSPFSASSPGVRGVNALAQIFLIPPREKKSSETHFFRRKFAFSGLMS